MKFDLIALAMISMLWAPPVFSDTAEENEPSLEFLEFLGSFETIDGQWLDPTDLEKETLEEDEEEEGEE